MPDSSIVLSNDTKHRLLINEAKRWVGVAEQGGNNNGQLVKIFQKAVDGVAEQESWCMSFAQYCIKQVDKVMKVLKPTAQAMALKASEHCLTVYAAAPVKLAKPIPGCLVIWQHGTGSSGHVGIVVAVRADGSIDTVEGNTGPDAGVNADGDGVYAKHRSVGQIGDMHIKGFIDPWA